MELPLKPSALGTLLAIFALTMAGCQAEAPPDDVSHHQGGAEPAPIPQPARVEAPASPADATIDTVRGDAAGAIGTALEDVVRSTEATQRDTPPASTGI